MIDMSTEQFLMDRSHAQCELCQSAEQLTVQAVAPFDNMNDAELCILLCNTCKTQIQQPDNVDPNHWRCLNDSMWSQTPAVQVMAWRMLSTLAAKEMWAQDLLDMMYLEDDVRQWAESGLANTNSAEADAPTLDSNGTVLNVGDTVTLIKDLPVKGAGFTAKRGTAVRGISLTNNPEQIEGRVNGVRVVLLTQYLKKA